ncbi:MAG: hypothetical protein DMG70_07050 [Acidobacteria bacterium]|nr:MAG: hypothetical protein DMG70_07050 [Acidobacteriota bacterium]
MICGCGGVFTLLLILGSPSKLRFSLRLFWLRAFFLFRYGFAARKVDLAVFARGDVRNRERGCMLADLFALQDG